VPINRVKDREREENKRREKRKYITALGSSGGFSGWSGCSNGGRVQKACPFSFPTLWAPDVPPQGRGTVTKVLEMSQWVQRGLGGITGPLCSVDRTLTFSLAQVFIFPADVASQRDRGGFCKTASCLCGVPIACHGPL